MQMRQKDYKRTYGPVLPIILACFGLWILREENRSLEPMYEDFSVGTPGHANARQVLAENNQRESANQQSQQKSTNNLQAHSISLLSSSFEEYRLPIPGSPDYDEHAPTIVVQLGGNTFNNIAHVARGLGISLMLQREYQTNATLVLKQQKASVAREAERDVKQCFPFMTKFDFGAGATAVVEDEIKKQKEDPVFKEIDRVINLHNNRTLPLMQKQLPIFLEKFQNQHQSLGAENGNVNLPLLYAWRLTCSGPLMDKYYDDFRNIFQFDEDSCCLSSPDPDESVFHFRNYQTEMSGDNGKSGFVELDAERVANDLFAHLGSGDKVAIVSRYETGVQDFIDAFSKRGIVARLVTGQTGMQDFCFLLRAEKEVVGTTRSSFFMYAGFLSRAKTVRAYLASAPDSKWGDMYEWSHPTLKERFRYHSFALEAAE